MYKYLFYILVFGFPLLFCPDANSQPKFIMQFTGGYSLPLPDLKGEFGPTLATFTENNPDTATYYITNGYNFGIYGKKAFGKTGNFRVAGAITYNFFYQNKEYSDTNGYSTAKYNLSLLSITMGAEWSFLSKKSKFNPFAGADMMANFFSGSYEGAGPIGDASLTLDPAMRIGIQFGGGIDISFSHNIGSVLGVKYTIANLIGKKGGNAVGSRYPLEDIRNGKKRTISYLQFYAGVSFYFGY